MEESEGGKAVGTSKSVEERYDARKSLHVVGIIRRCVSKSRFNEAIADFHDVIVSAWIKSTRHKRENNKNNNNKHRRKAILASYRRRGGGPSRDFIGAVGDHGHSPRQRHHIRISAHASVEGGRRWPG